VKKDAITISGLGSVKEVLDSIGEKYAPSLIRSTVHAIARQIAADAKTFAPVDTGRLKKGIRAERRRMKKGGPARSDVVVKDPKTKTPVFYWHFVERGTRAGAPEQPFIRPAVAIATANITETYRTHFGIQLEKMLERRAKAARKKAGLE